MKPKPDRLTQAIREAGLGPEAERIVCSVYTPEASVFWDVDEHEVELVFDRAIVVVAQP